jgi:D-alanine-D-alanine ligase
MGGPSAEHEVSLRTGREILTHLDREKYRPRIVIISNDIMFFYSDNDISELSENDCAMPHNSAFFTGPLYPAQSQEIWDGFSMAFLALHGEFGEDGRFQGFLETIGMPYSGSGVFASAVGMEKIASKQLFEQHGLVTPPYSVYYPTGSTDSIATLAQKHGFPCYVKCPQSGSSRLMGRAESQKDLEILVHEFSRNSRTILIESNIAGDEYSCPVLSYPDGRCEALLPILIKPLRSSFFDYEAKYSSGHSEEIVPAPCSNELTRRLQDTALTAHTALQCRGLSRTDMIAAGDTIFVLEINTLPGLTSASLAPKSFAASGGTYTQLLDIIIASTLAGHKG